MSTYRNLVRKYGINDHKRRLWILNNDEGLYNWYRTSRLGMSKFIACNRHEITVAILGILEG